MEKTLVATKRETRPKGLVNRLRKEGSIPAVVCTPHEESTSISISSYDFKHLFHTVSENTIISLKIGTKSRDVLVKDFYRHPVSGEVHHIDFLEIHQNEKLRTHVPLELVGTPAGVREGGILERQLINVEVECLPRHLPEIIKVNIEHLGVGDPLHVNELPSIPGVKIYSDGEQLIALVSAPRTETEAAEEEEVLVEEEESEEST